MTLIVAILIIAFRKLNKISSYKIAKLRFAIEIENIMIGQIVQLCGGDLKKFNKLYDP
ncbi:MAG: IS4/IS5 family transposase, partial [Bacteroidetes bacterium]